MWPGPRGADTPSVGAESCTPAFPFRRADRLRKSGAGPPRSPNGDRRRRGESPGAAGGGRGGRGAKDALGSSWDHRDEITVPPQRVEPDALKRVRAGWRPGGMGARARPGGVRACAERSGAGAGCGELATDGRWPVRCCFPQARIAYFEEKQAILARFRDRALEEASNRGDVLLAP